LANEPTPTTPTLSIVIPVYNEIRTLQTLLDRVYAFDLPGIERQFVIVESNSKDGSREVVREWAAGKDDVTVIWEDRPGGKGTAMRKGFVAATGEIILIQDADLEYDVADYPKLIQPILDGETDFVLGSRHSEDTGLVFAGVRQFEGRERLFAYFMNFGEMIFHGGFNILYGTKLQDPTTMYKVFRRRLLREVHLTGQYFELDWEIVGKFVRLGHVPIEVPITYNSRGMKEGKKVSVRRDVVRWVWMMLKVRFMPKSKL
jgi:glycosyltransferase involved in cell wall biosynthesis